MTHGQKCQLDDALGWERADLHWQIFNHHLHNVLWFMSNWCLWLVDLSTHLLNMAMVRSAGCCWLLLLQSLNLQKDTLTLL